MYLIILTKITSRNLPTFLGIVDKDTYAHMMLSFYFVVHIFVFSTFVAALLFLTLQVLLFIMHTKVEPGMPSLVPRPGTEVRFTQMPR